MQVPCKGTFFLGVWLCVCWQWITQIYQHLHAKNPTTRVGPGSPRSGLPEVEVQASWKRGLPSLGTTLAPGSVGPCEQTQMQQPSCPPPPKAKQNIINI